MFNLMFLKSVRDDVHVEAGHVGDVDADLEDLRTAVDHHPVKVDGSYQVLPVWKLSWTVRSCFINIMQSLNVFLSILFSSK